MPDLDPIPNNDPDLTVALRRYLAGVSAITSVVGPGTYVDSLPLTQSYSTWIFQWRAYVDIENTGQALIIVSQGTGWTSPNSYNTMRFPTILIEIQADANRDGSLEPVNAVGAEQRAFSVFKILDPYLHLVDTSPVYFDSLRVVSCKRMNEPTVVTTPDKDGVVSLMAHYQLIL
jgi:hypothetical protein